MEGLGKAVAEAVYFLISVFILSFILAILGFININAFLQAPGINSAQQLFGVAVAFIITGLIKPTVAKWLPFLK